jgi:hypothetical protein
MKLRMFSVISLVLILSLACLASGKSRKTTAIPPTESFVTSEAVTTSEQPSDIQGSSQSCQPDKWEVVPIDVQVQPDYEPDGSETPTPSGWNYVYVTYAVINRSDFWGNIYIHTETPSITTEGGFTYNALGVQSQNYTMQDVQVAQEWSRSQIWFFQPRYLLPPGLLSTGEVVDNYGNWSYIPIYSVFKVAATQKQLTLSVNEMSVVCIENGIGQEGTMPSRTYKLGNLKNDWQTYLTSASLPDLGKSIKFADFGTVTIKSVTNASGDVTIKFQFTNVNQGMEAGGAFHAYLIDDLGQIHEFFGGQFNAGPAMTVDGQDLETKGGVPTDDRNMKIVFWIDKGPSDTIIGSHTVYNFKP